jgi:two-component system, NarL family, nitrate/nitrite response regulator NarL
MTNAGNESIKVLLVDDHKIVRGGLRMMIEGRQNMRVVGEAGRKADVMPMVERERPDIVLLDLDLGGESGSDLIPEISSAGSRVLILTGTREAEAHRACVRLGASGLVMKDAAPEVLAKAIEKVHEGEIWFDRAMMSSVLTSALNQRRDVDEDPESAKIATLTERERQIVGLVCEGMKNKQIAERLFISDTTVRHHLTSIFSKLDVTDRLELLIYSYRYGLAKPPSKPPRV